MCIHSLRDVATRAMLRELPAVLTGSHSDRAGWDGRIRGEETWISRKPGHCVAQRERVLDNRFDGWSSRGESLVRLLCEELLQHRPQLFRVDRFAEVVVHSSVEAALAIAFQSVRRQGDDRDTSGEFLG